MYSKILFVIKSFEIVVFKKDFSNPPTEGLSREMKLWLVKQKHLLGLGGSMWRLVLYTPTEEMNSQVNI